MKKRYQIFIGSTFTDLKDERKQVIETILKGGYFPTGMEMFPSLGMEQFTYIKSIIDDSDYYILIIAGRYGSLTDDGISYTEKEYDYALEKGVPVLAFLKGDIDSIPANKTERNKSAHKKLLAFREKVKKNKLISYWDTPDKLIKDIALSIPHAIENLPRPGWVRGGFNDNGTASVNHIKKHKLYMNFEVIINDEVVYQSDRIGAILSSNGHESFSGLFNLTAIQLVKAYPKIEEFIFVAYHMACKTVGEKNVDKVFVNFIEYDTNIMHFGIRIFPDIENPDAFKYALIDWTEGGNIFISGKEWMN